LDPIAVGLLVFARTFGGALAGLGLGGVVPKHHISGESKDAVQLGVGLVATMTALVLGLLTASAKSSFDALDGAVKRAGCALGRWSSARLCSRRAGRWPAASAAPCRDRSSASSSSGSC
jgi:hypothetical protein